MRSSLILLCLQLWGSVQVSLSQNVTCPDLPNVSHAVLTKETKRSEYREGNVIHFTCETGYISGPTIRYMCTAGGWFGIHVGPCYLKPCQLPDDTPNGYYQIVSGEDFVFGTTIKYFCNEGYQMVSRVDTRTCLLNKWTNHVPICDPLSCEPPPADERLIIKGLPDNDDAIHPDRFLTFSCQGSGTYLNGSSMLICGRDGKWNEPFPSCEDITCEVKEVQPHLRVDGLQPDNQTVKAGQVLEFQCSDQYTLHGPTAITCLSSGEWSAPFPTCAATCKLPQLPYPVQFTRYVSDNPLRTGQKLHFSCRFRGQFLQGNASIECLANGQWSGPVPTCGEPSGCKNPPPLVDGDTKERLKFSYRHYERVEYSCQNLYTMEGDPHKTCINGEWTGQMRCLKPCTVNREVMRRHNIIFRYGNEEKMYAPHYDTLTFTCIGGRSHDGRVNMRQRCLDGVINLPTCI